MNDPDPAGAVKSPWTASPRLNTPGPLSLGVSPDGSSSSISGPSAASNCIQIAELGG